MPPKSGLAILVILCSIAGTATFRGLDASARSDEAKRATLKSVPFKLAKPDKPLILLQTIVNRKGPYRFVLDTGAGPTMISPELAKKLEVKRDETHKAVGAGGSLEVRFATLSSLAVGGTQLEGLMVGIMDLRGISKAIETDIDGIVGYNFLKKFRVSIDYPTQTVTFE
jgi:predicted aspartyl protease